MKVICGFCLLLIFVQNGFAQNVFTNLNSLEKRADKHYAEKSYMSAIDLYKQLLEKPKNIKDNNLTVKLAKAYLSSGQMELAITSFRTCLANGYTFSNSDSLKFASLLIGQENLEEGKLWIPKTQETENGIVPSVIYKSIENRQVFYRDSFSFSVKPILFNSKYSDFCPVYFKNEIVFSSDRPSSKIVKQINTQRDAGFSELYFFEEKDTLSSALKSFEIDYNSSLHKGPVIFYDNGNKMIVTLNSKKGASNRLQLFTAEWDKKKATWSNLKPFIHNSDFYSVGHPALSKDERILYFVSDLPGGNGGTDLYFSVLKDGEWTKPKNMREPINTEANEMFPYISPSGVFYFSSNGHGGLGGMDIFYTANTNSNEVAIFNPGYPLNSSGDDFGLVFNNEEKSGYFSSNRKGGKGDDDVYELYVKSVVLKLKVSDEVTGAATFDPSIKLVDQETGEEILAIKSIKKENKYNFILKLHHEYKLIIEKDNYRDFERDISTMGYEGDQIIEMKAILKRRFDYFVTLKIRDKETENIIDDAIVRIINLTSLELDSLEVKKSGELDLKLDADSEYLIVAYTSNTSGQMHVEKQNKKKVSTIRFQTLILSEEVSKWESFQLLDKNEKGITNPVSIRIRDMITGLEETITSSENGLIKFKLRGNWYYRMYYGNEQFYYDSLKKSSNGDLIFKPINE